MMLVIDKS